MSSVRTRSPAAGSYAAEAPRWISRASSPPSITRNSIPHCPRVRSTNSAPFAAPRNALVPTTTTSPTPKFRAHSRITPNASSPRANRSGVIIPALNPPVPNRTGSRNRKHSRHRLPPSPSTPSGSTSTTSIVNVFVPQSIAARRSGRAKFKKSKSLVPKVTRLRR